MKQLKIAPLVSILLYWPIIICWPTNRFIGQARHWRVNRNRTSKAALIFRILFPPFTTPLHLYARPLLLPLRSSTFAVDPQWTRKGTEMFRGLARARPCFRPNSVKTTLTIPTWRNRIPNIQPMRLHSEFSSRKLTKERAACLHDHRIHSDTEHS